MDTKDSQPLGLAVPLARGNQNADIISAVEQVTGGDTLISVGSVFIHLTGKLGRVSEKATLRLTADEREELIALLMTHRFADMTAELGSEGQR